MMAQVRDVNARRHAPPRRMVCPGLNGTGCSSMVKSYSMSLHASTLRVRAGVVAAGDRARAAERRVEVDFRGEIVGQQAPLVTPGGTSPACRRTGCRPSGPGRNGSCVRISPRSRIISLIS